MDPVWQRRALRLERGHREGEEGMCLRRSRGRIRAPEQWGWDRRTYLCQPGRLDKRT